MNKYSSFVREYLVLLVSMIFQVIVQWHYTSAVGDNFAQFEMALNWYKGNGIQLCNTNPLDLSENLCGNILLWPPGYMFLLKVVYPFFNDFLLTSRFIDCIGIILILYFHFRTLQILAFPRRIITVIFIFLAFSFAPFSYLFSTDLWVLVMYQISIWFSIRVLHSKVYSVWDIGILAGLICSMVLFKYMYYLLCVIPFSFFMISLLNKDKELRQKTYLLTFVIGILAVGFFLFLKIYTGSFTYLNNQEPGIFGEHLLHIDSFPMKSIFYIANIEKYFIIYGLSNHWIVDLFRLILFISSCIIVWSIFNFIFFRERVIQNISKQYLRNTYFIIILVSLVFNIVYLAILSLLLPPQTGWIDFWTYIQETRYYGVSMWGIMTLLFYIAFQNNMPWLYRYSVRVLVIFSFLFAGVYMTYRVVGVSFFNRTTYTIYDLYDELWEVNETLSELTFENKNYTFSAYDNRITRYANFSGIKDILIDQLLENGLQTTKPVSLILYLPEKEITTTYAKITRDYSFKILKKIKHRNTVFIQIDLKSLQ